ncbi:hypothetical protein HIM_04324 [Hirsutella minnesotensis 3608]|uniref:Uncharacterized protein n=1 Tax=Hirsutella minnesotensis 3608 TaxID=1043627 RepID=A0A0F8A1I6_9HYPO|nr:hypothetical protein HIM_04324 [Hirsutella minnesotensis 3608]
MDAKSSASWMPKGVTKSNSTASAGGRSTRSHESVKVIGGHAFGTLHIVRHDDSPRQSMDEDAGEEIPPLDPPATQQTLLTLTSQPSSPRNVMIHAMEGGDIVLVLHLPEAYTIGYNSISFTAKQFIGIKNLPAGPHFFWASHPESTSTRCGFWIMSSGANRVHVVQWHRYNEVFVRPTRTETRIQAENVDKIYDKLPSYRDPSTVGSVLGNLSLSQVESNLEIWEQLSNSISKETLDRMSVDPECGWNVHTCDRVKGALRLPAEMELDRRLSRGVFQSQELKFSFEQLSKTYSLAAVGRDRTLDANDSTAYILSTMSDSQSNHLSEDDILGEFQFAYIVGVYLGNDACIQQWWFMVLRIFLKAYRLVLLRPSLAVAVLRALTAQLTHSMNWLEESILNHSEMNSHDLRVALIIYKRRLRENLRSSSGDPNPTRAAVGVAFSRLEATVAQLGWDLDAEYLRKGKVTLEDGDEVDVELDELEAEDERGEWAPEIVELDESGRQIGLVSWS